MNSSSSTSSSSNESTETFEISKNLRGLFAGSGVEGLSNPLINQQIVDLLPAEKKKSMNDVKVVYLGTATYDIAFFKDKQTGRFVDRGCQVSSLDIASKGVELDDAALETIASADVLLVGGGNTLYAVDRWRHLGLVPHLKKAMENGCILTGGSAGAICWFDSGHSDSADPETYRQPMLKKYGNNESEKPKDESSEYDPANKKEWKYLRVQGLGFVPGPMVCCPHHDKTQSNGLLRAYDFDKMLLERAKSSSKSVLGIGIDHYAAFVVEGENYRVYVLPDKAGSVSSSRRESDAYDEEETSFFDVGEDGTANGTPGVWIKRVVVASSSNNNNDNGDNSLVVEAMVCPPEGKLVDLLAYGGNNLPGQNNEEHDENQTAVETCRRENPSGIQG
jgi:dipeptidase E